MKKLLLFCLFLVSLQSAKCQMDSTKLANYTKWNSGVTFTIQVGSWEPLGNLKNTFRTNFNIGAKAGFPLLSKVRFDIGFSINVPQQAKPFMYYADDTTFLAWSSNTVNGMLGFWFAHEQQLGHTFFFDKYAGFGIGFIQTTSKRRPCKTCEEETYSVDTAIVNVGLSLRKIVSRRSSLGIYVEYNFAPYSLFGRVKNEFGTSYLISGVSIRF